MARIGIIGGSGLYEMDGVSITEERRLSTPFGQPSDAIMLGELDTTPIAFLSRHGRGHRYNPSEINYRANLWALRKVGVDFILSVSATGSMRDTIEPGHLVLVDQFIDMTRGQRKHTFFDNGIVAHVGFADPTSIPVRKILASCARELDITHHDGGTYVCIEGPQFSTRAESRRYQAFGADVIGMTNLTEAKLAREAEIHYATIAMATDYDVWHESEEDVSVAFVLQTMRDNVGKAKALIRMAVPRVAALRGTPEAKLNALEFAVMTQPALIPPAAKERVELFMSKYWDRK